MLHLDGLGPSQRRAVHGMLEAIVYGNDATQCKALQVLIDDMQLANRIISDMTSEQVNMITTYRASLAGMQQ